MDHATQQKRQLVLVLTLIVPLQLSTVFPTPNQKSIEEHKTISIDFYFFPSRLLLFILSSTTFTIYHRPSPVANKQTAMDRQQLLRGGCACGRNRYVVQIPQNSSEVPHVFFDNSHTHRKFFLLALTSLHPIADRFYCVQVEVKQPLYPPGSAFPSPGINPPHKLS
jgi:hypothetical protein